MYLSFLTLYIQSFATNHSTIVPLSCPGLKPRRRNPMFMQTVCRRGWSSLEEKDDNVEKGIHDLKCVLEWNHQ